VIDFLDTVILQDKGSMKKAMAIGTHPVLIMNLTSCCSYKDLFNKQKSEKYQNKSNIQV